MVDRLAWTSAFAADPETKGTARWIIRKLAAASGIHAASIHDLYMAVGRGYGPDGKPMAYASAVGAPAAR